MQSFQGVAAQQLTLKGFRSKASSPDSLSRLETEVVFG